MDNAEKITTNILVGDSKLGQAYEDEEKYDQAINVYEQLLHKEFSINILLRLLQLYRVRGNWELIERTVLDNLDSVDESDIFTKNIILNEFEIAQRKTILSTKVRNLAVTLTNRCNLNCVMCTARENPWDLPKRTVEEIMEFFPYLEFIMWRGGEVFLMDYFVDLLEEARRYPNMKQLIITNGLLLSHGLIKKLIMQPKLVLTISIDSLTKDIYESIRRGAKFDTLIKNLDLINNMRKLYHSDMALNLNIVVMKSNYKEVYNFIEFAKEYGFGTLLFAPPSGSNCNEINIFRSDNAQEWMEVQRVMEGVQQKASEYKIVIDNRLPHYGSFAKEEESGRNSSGAFLCYAPWQRLCINWGGNVYPDCMCLNPAQGGVGNVKQHTIQDIWNSSGMQMYRKKIIDGEFQDLCNLSCISGQIPDRYLKLNR
jgi:MoaA/NifB/PqqE/SkfB family radical SAM enzyme